MVNMTLDAMIQEVATYIDEDIGASPYSGDNLKIVNKIKSGINYAYMKISKDKWKPFKMETVTLDNNSQFSVVSLTNTFSGIIKITSSDINQSYEFIDNITIECENVGSGGSIDVYYYYTPTELNNSTDKIVQPDGSFDNKILCFYGAYHYLTIENDETAAYWLNLFNDGFDDMNQSRGSIVQVKTGMGW